jgi:outer membrane protein OmpA-like peptidoglycan-associated protein
VNKRIWRAALGAAFLGTFACQTAYNNAYNKQYEQLSQEQQQQQAMDAAAHAEAQKYAAVVYFPTGSAVLDADAQQQLRWFAGKMTPYPQARFAVQGFADSTGAELTNQMISSQRAQACADYLASLGIAQPRMQVMGFSTSSPAASNANTQGRKNNRRVEITVL